MISHGTSVKFRFTDKICLNHSKLASFGFTRIDIKLDISDGLSSILCNQFIKSHFFVRKRTNIFNFGAMTYIQFYVNTRETERSKVKMVVFWQI